jgi:hypothetical protein
MIWRDPHPEIIVSLLWRWVNTPPADRAGLGESDAAMVADAIEREFATSPDVRAAFGTIEAFRDYRMAATAALMAGFALDDREVQ